MIDQWIKRLSDSLGSDVANDSSSSGSSHEDAFERVSAALLVEIARADHGIDDVELKAIKTAIEQSSTSLSEQDIDEITALALQDADHSVSLYEQVQVINASCTREQKTRLVEHMWRVALADGNLDKYEEYSIRKLCDLLHVRHREYLQAKHKVVDNG